MISPRVIPCLLISDNGLVKTKKFSEPRYVGDPLNAVRIFNEKEVDELIVLDIDASRNDSDPNLKLIELIASECRMPLCYGGGIKTARKAQEIVSLGVEKVALSHQLLQTPELAREISRSLGAQSLVAVLDVKKTLLGGFQVFSLNGSVKSRMNPREAISVFQDFGVGEIVLNSIDDDGSREGYNFDLIDEVISHVTVPLTVMGGAGSSEDISELVARFGFLGAAAGSLFVFQGKYRAVLISYLNDVERESIRAGSIRHYQT
jgi:cyclase